MLLKRYPDVAKGDGTGSEPKKATPRTKKRKSRSHVPKGNPIR